jgi:hypothetical protein
MERGCCEMDGRFLELHAVLHRRFEYHHAPDRAQHEYLDLFPLVQLGMAVAASEV